MLYKCRAGYPAMTINAHVISGLDPGAVPGGSTISTKLSNPLCLYWGRNRIDRRVKMLAFVRMGIVKCPITVIANDNSTEEFALAA